MVELMPLAAEQIRAADEEIADLGGPGPDGPDGGKPMPVAGNVIQLRRVA